MQPRPTPTSPRFAHRYPTPLPPNVPQLLATAFVAAGLAVLLGAVLFRMNQAPTVTVAPGASQPSHPLERLREQRGSAALLRVDGEAVVGVAVAVSSDGWVVSVGETSAGLRVPEGTVQAPISALTDTATGARFLRVDAQLDPVPLAVPEERYVGEPVAFLLPGALPGELDVLSGTLTAVRVTRTGTSAQSSDASPTAVRAQASSTPPPGTPAFTLSGQLVGLVLGGGPVGTVNLLPAWNLRTAIGRMLEGGTVPRATLGLTGRPAELLEPGTTGFRIDASGVARGSAAALVGITAGATVESINDSLIGPEEALGDLLLAYEPGDRVTLRVRSTAGERRVEVTLGPIAP